MAAFFDYLRNITYYLLFAAVAGMVAPAGKYKKYIALVTGLILVCLMLKPLGALAADGIQATELFAGLARMPVADEEGAYASYEVWRYETVKEAFAEQLRLQLQAMLAQNGYTLFEADFEYAEDFSAVTFVSAAVSPGDAGRPFIYIEPVRIGRPAGSAAAQDPDESTVKKLIADFYNVPEQHISVEVKHK